MKQEVLAALNILKGIKGSKNLKYGICHEVSLRTECFAPYKIYNVFAPHFETWEKFSGDKYYPIPSASKHYTPRDAFSLLPKWTGKCGKLRRELLDHLINEIEKELAGAQ